MADIEAMYYYAVTDPASIQTMHDLRASYLALGADLLALLPESRAKSLAITELEYSLMRAMQALAMASGVKQRG